MDKSEKDGAVTADGTGSGPSGAGGVKTTAARRLWHAMRELIMPDLCRQCGQNVPYEAGHQGICRRCLQQVVYISGKGCRICGVVSPSLQSVSHTCGRCLKKTPPFRVAIALCSYQDPVRTLLHRLKYSSDTRVIPALSSIVNCGEWSPTTEYDLVLPVPLHKSRLQERGLNQALYLAKILFPDPEDHIEPALLVRQRKTVPQTGLDAGRRRSNLRGAFAVRAPKRIENKRICLVDDVFTTGTTVSECARTLRYSGAREVDVVTMAGVVVGDNARTMSREKFKKKL